MSTRYSSMNTRSNWFPTQHLNKLFTLPSPHNDNHANCRSSYLLIRVLCVPHLLKLNTPWPTTQKPSSLTHCRHPKTLHHTPPPPQLPCLLLGLFLTTALSACLQTLLPHILLSSNTPNGILTLSLIDQSVHPISH
jgi:hypothetical protein